LGLGVSRVTYLIGTDGVIREAAKAAFRVAPHLDIAKRAASSPK
jgi:peroxiredoxin